MKYIRKNFRTYKLHIIKTKKFKTITIRINFRSPIIKEEITIRNILSEMFTQSSKNYKTKRDLTINAQDLYSVGITTSNTRLGNYINLNFFMNVLNDKYTEKDNFKKSFNFFTDVIFNPDVDNEKFNKEKLDIVKDLCRKSLLSIKEDPAGYSVIRMFEALDKKSPISYRMMGYLEDLDKINEKNLYQYYQKVLKNDLVDIFVIGDVDEEEIIKLVKEKMTFKTLKKERMPYILDEVKPRNKIKKTKETINNNQSKLVIGCRTFNMNEYEKNYVLSLFNVIFGGSSDSKLFKEVREENSLCYTIHSVPNKLDNLLIIRVGIDKENYEKTVSLINKILISMRKGKFSEEDITIAKEYYKTALDDIEENEYRLIDNYFMMELINTDSLDEKRKNIDKVNKSDIIKVAKKIKIDTIFLLEGDINEKN
ncbi:MAG: insulinase family protein [Bacilli bacterium]|nr:insulinase family protein [Bacilli bacterium]